VRDARGDTVTVEAPARLHFGLLDLRGALGRRFGGIGAPAPAITVRVSVCLANDIEAEGPDADRAAEFVRRFLTHYSLGGGARIRVERAIPAHSGLGSGTQLGLSIARGAVEANGGHLSLFASSEQGSTFRIAMPRLAMARARTA